MFSQRLIHRTLSLIRKFNAYNFKDAPSCNLIIPPASISSFHQYSTDPPTSEHVRYSYPEVIEDTIEDDRIKSANIIKKVNDHIADGSYGRLFAVIQIRGKQYKITAEDLIVIERNWTPKIKDIIRFEKILVVGGANFTLIGKPILPKNLVNVSASVVSEDLTYTKFRLHRIPKERVHNLNFVREKLTFLKIFKIEVYPHVNELTHTECIRSF